MLYIKKETPHSPTTIYLPKLLVTLAIILVSFVLFRSWFMTNYTYSTRIVYESKDYRRLMNTPLEQITETLTSNQLNNTIFLSLMDLAATYPEAKILLARHESYPDILLDLAGNRPETLDFVLHYPKYLESSQRTPISIHKEYTEGSIPLFIQWDKRWGYEAYGNEFIASSGCGPTALSMVAVGLTGNTDLHPKAVSDFSYASGYFHSGVGTDWNLMTTGARKLGLNAAELPLHDDLILSHLQQGHPIILSMKPGNFTNAGHFIVLTGIAPDGSIIVNDPGSIEKSNQTWDLDTLMSETKNLWVFSLES